MYQNTTAPGISGSTLKLIAIITMFIDHAGATVIRTMQLRPDVLTDPQSRLFWSELYSVSRSIGRIAFPIFCFLLVEGFLHTRSVQRYLKRMLLFALVSEIPFDLALKGSWYFPEKQNVYFTLLIGLLVLTGFRWCSRFFITDNVFAKAEAASSSSRMFRQGIDLVLCCISCLLILAAGMRLALWIDTDYNYKGVLLIAVLYVSRQIRPFQCIAGAAAVSWELPAPAAFLPVLFYNGQRGLQMKYFFYWFYPVHLVLLHMAALAIRFFLF